MTPRATYRLQFNPGFTFADAAALAPYLARLGVSHLYASPWLKARAGSQHGYDIVDHTAFNPELGGDAGFETLHTALKAQGLGQILDFVPNHMGIAEAGNSWWLDVLEWGRASPCADWFDIDWTPADPDLRNKLLLPFLGDHYGAVLERGELVPRFDPVTGTFSVWYFDHRFPLAPHTYADVLRAAANGHADVAASLTTLAQAATHLRPRAGSTARNAARIRDAATAFKVRLAADTALHAALRAGAAALAAQTGRPNGWRALHRLLERQSWRLAYWRVAADEINYRRFFDINTLAALRVENPEVFARIHVLVARLIEQGKLDGLRIDHLDGLFDPAQYCRRLRRLVRRPFYLVVEKVLARHERLRADWPIEGSTGYDFLNQVNALLVDPRGGAALTRAYARVTAAPREFDEVVYAAKKQILRTRLSAELHVLARHLHRIARQQPRTRDYTLSGLTQALAEVVAAFPVYRTYIDARGADDDDRRDIAWAVGEARKRWEQPGGEVFDFIGTALSGDLAGYAHAPVLRFAMQFQQYTSPVMAKGCEDTALYRYHRLDALNDVGGDPRQLGMTVTAFHRANQERARHWPHAMLATATHDSKRGEDVRARLVALSACAPDWASAARHWIQLNRGWKRRVHERLAPDGNDEYLLYQTLIGAWPVELMDGAWDATVAGEFIARIRAYMQKAVREAKLHSSWSDPDADYETAMAGFIAQILDHDSGRLFLDAFLPLQRRVAELGAANSLVQLTLKLTCPGVPDIYQGCELWDLSLVDPDNRRPVDFKAREKLLQKVQAWDALQPQEQGLQLATWRQHWQDGAIKLHVLRRLLGLRAAHPRLFSDGDYRPIKVPKELAAGDVIAFERGYAGARVVVAALLHTHGPAAAAAIAQVLRPANSALFVNVLDGQRYAGGAAPAESRRADLPVAVWLQEAGPAAR